MSSLGEVGRLLQDMSIAVGKAQTQILEMRALMKEYDKSIPISEIASCIKRSKTQLMKLTTLLGACHDAIQEEIT